MKRKVFNKKLNLNKETVSRLNQNEMIHLKGGGSAGCVDADIRTSDAACPETRDPMVTCPISCVDRDCMSNKPVCGTYYCDTGVGDNDLNASRPC